MFDSKQIYRPLTTGSGLHAQALLIPSCALMHKNTSGVSWYAKKGARASQRYAEYNETLWGGGSNRVHSSTARLQQLLNTAAVINDVA